MLLTELFLNLCIFIALIFLYLQVKWNTKLGKLTTTQTAFIDGIAGGLLGNILMYFSISVTSETLVDLRFIPVMVLMLFIGIYPALISTVLIILGRFIYGINSSSLYNIVLMIVILLGCIVIMKVIKNHTYKRALAMIIHVNITFSIIITLIIQKGSILVELIPLYWLLSTIGGTIAVYIVGYIRKTHLLLKKYENESTTDYLTGLNNVRQFDAIWNTLVQNANEKSERLSLFVLDIDYFKKVNDTYGHAAGDLVLKELGTLLTKTTRSFDIVSRNGGEEFTVILPDCPAIQAAEIAEKIRVAVETHLFPINEHETIHITVSIGVASFPERTHDTELLITHADEYLYNAKRLGRNRVCIK